MNDLPGGAAMNRIRAAWRAFLNPHEAYDRWYREAWQFAEYSLEEYTVAETALREVLAATTLYTAHRAAADALGEEIPKGFVKVPAIEIDPAADAMVDGLFRKAKGKRK
jgi:hypothetical protein